MGWKVTVQPHEILTETELLPPLPTEIRKTMLEWTCDENWEQISNPELLFQISALLRHTTKAETLSNVLLIPPRVQTVAFYEICFYCLEKQEKKILICNSVSSGFWIKPLLLSGVSRMVSVVFWFLGVLCVCVCVFLIGVQLFCNVVWFNQMNQLYVYIYSLPLGPPSHPSRSSQSTKPSCLCFIEGLFVCLFVFQ